MKKLFVLSALLVFIAMLAGCSSSGGYTVKQAFIEPVANDKTVSIVVKADGSQGSNEDIDKMVVALREKLITIMMSEGVFKSSVLSPNQGDYELQVNVQDAKIVSNAARMMLGVMAGPSIVKTDVTLKNADKVIVAFNAEGSSAAHPLSSETGYDNAAREVALNIAKALKSK